ncbi:MAG: hypothetical protein AB2L26_04500 [Ignavibacteria bacterium]
MKTIKLVSVLLLLCLLAFKSSEGQVNRETRVADRDNSIQELRTKIVDGNSIYENTITGGIVRTESAKEKSPFLGGLFSAVVPGAGEFYAEKYVKSAIFLAIEAGLWITYATFQKKGNDQTNFYEDYADQNWSIIRYASWLKDQNFPKSGEINLASDPATLRMQVNACETESGFSHTLPNYGEQQYYEVIGKYRTYTCGWTESVGKGITKQNYETFPLLSQVNYYMDERQKANNYYDNGTTTMMVVILNHIASAVDGVISVNSYNNKLSVQGNVSFAPVYSYREGRSKVTPFFNLKVGF